ncbi:hypothetical protein CLOBY_00330 [Clostridium saccharobutylicum]|uniref:hypothetical protein n=1 Tax=Clostridium saccharobutylicum TaxID=169679 RepID=UPI000983A558|nr:hypothetical protein [Clostridium saccharobutylicum]AQS07984.1 hypothetical protein CLOBY_00330 [Clostridium saccharobutylicum]MBC2436961.1 hypothetical protein [Clostridium saccharobutylicum]NSB89312.1 hypothetical protein [Clostridium saccharobutylicum]NYC29698.1 hypothetical protein [Clostridium saccharobutylicum]OOM17315.1 hypothetical protein CLSAB_17400 [Clostridium saccharobutylicum]
MIKTSDLKIDKTCLGKDFLLVDIVPSYKYENGNKTNILQGYRYDVALPHLKMEKLGVKIENNAPLIDISNDENEIPMKNVIFDNLEIGFYLSQGNIVNLKATATNISFAK